MAPPAPAVPITVVSGLCKGTINPWDLGGAASLQGWVHSGRCLGDSHCAFCWNGWTTQNRVKTPSSFFTTSSTAWGKRGCFKPSPKPRFEALLAGTWKSFRAASP